MKFDSSWLSFYAKKRASPNMLIHSSVSNCIERGDRDEILDVQIIVRSQLESSLDHFATLEIAFGVTPKAKTEERSGSMPLRQIDAASQRSAPGFSAIRTMSASDVTSIFRMTCLR